MVAQAEQADEHDDEQERVRNKGDHHCHFGGLNVAGGARNLTCIVKLSEELAYNV